MAKDNCPCIEDPVVMLRMRADAQSVAFNLMDSRDFLCHEGTVRFVAILALVVLVNCNTTIDQFVEAMRKEKALIQQ